MPLFAVCSFVLATGVAKCSEPMNAEAAIAAVVANNELSPFDPKGSATTPYTIFLADKRPSSTPADLHLGMGPLGSGTTRP